MLHTLEDFLVDWEPPVTSRSDVVAAGPVRALASALGLDDATALAMPEALLPPAWHWLSFHDWPAAATLNADGHPLDAADQPPIPHRRRMWAGGRLTTQRPLRIDRPTDRRSAVVAVRPVSARSGDLVFVTTRHEFAQDGERCVVEEVDAVYRSAVEPRRTAPRPTDAPSPTVADAEVDRIWRPDEVLLFRFSALTANSHRIHYDRPYTCDVEGYPGLVVHGPLLVLLMLEAVRGAGWGRVVDVDYRLHAPVFLGEELRVHARRSATPDGVPTATVGVATAREPVHARLTVTFR